MAQGLPWQAFTIDYTADCPCDQNIFRTMPEIVIDVDYRERRSGVIDALEKRKAAIVHQVSLESGDYKINSYWLVERKTLVDLVASIVDGRLFRQLARFCFPYRKVLLIEGTAEMLGSSGVRREAIQGALVTVALCFGMARLRSTYGEKDKVYVKYHPSDLGFIDVFNSHKNEFFRVPAVDYSYANNLTLFQHRMIKEYVKEEMKQSDEDIKLLMDGKIQLREMVNECLENNPKALKGKRGAKIREGGFTSPSPNFSHMQYSGENRSDNKSPNVIGVPENDFSSKEDEHDNWDGSNIEWD